jgi:hypothetical protein
LGGDGAEQATEEGAARRGQKSIKLAPKLTQSSKIN